MRIDWLGLYQKSALGGLGGLLGWGLVSLLAPAAANDYVAAFINGALVGIALGAACGAWDGLFRNRSARRAVHGAAVGAGVGCVGGMLGLVIGQAVEDIAGGGLAVRAVGWAIFGAAVGANEGVARKRPVKTLFGSYGGMLGGLIGGSSYAWLFEKIQSVFSRDAGVAVGGAIGLVLLGLFVGAFMGLVEDLLRAAWLMFTAGRLEGQTRTLDPTRPTDIGRSDAADICILGDPQLQARHARIVCDGGTYVVEPQEGPVAVGRAGKLEPSRQRQPLQNGDLIQLGGTRAVFQLGRSQT